LKYIKDFSVILGSIGLFKGIEAGDLKSMLSCLNASTHNYKKGRIVMLSGDKPEFVGIVLSGQLNISRVDYDGNRSLVAAIIPGEMFAEALCCAGVTESPVTVFAAEDSVIIKLAFSRIIKTCPNSCSFHTQLIENMLGLIAYKNMKLQNRMEILELKSVREKVMCYLETFMPKRGENITIPFNREEMAEFLCVERSALSHELSKMKKDGLIEYRKNSFTIK